MNLKQRLVSPTSPFFKKIRNIGLLVASIGATLLAAPVALPPLLIKIGGYLVVAGTVATTVSQTTTEKHPVKKRKDGA